MAGMLVMPSILNMWDIIMAAEDKQSKKRLDRVIVKGYMRPDGTSYYVVIPKEVRELLSLKGGEYFVMKVKPEKREIELKIAKLVEERGPAA